MSDMSFADPYINVEITLYRFIQISKFFFIEMICTSVKKMIQDFLKSSFLF